MLATENTFKTNKTRRIFFVLCAFVLSYLVAYLIDPYSVLWTNYWSRDLADLAAEWLFSILFCFLIAEASLMIHYRLNNKYPWINNPAKRLAIEAFLNICAVLVFMVLNFSCMYLIYHKSHPAETEFSPENIRNLMQWAVVSFVISFIIVAVNTGSYLINNWKNTELQVIQHKLRESELKQASVQAELNALQLQIDPHFIFNNLSVLSELILEDKELAYQFSENFSKVYRFLLVNSRKNLISLDDEIKFLKAYIFLIQNRIGEGIEFELMINPASSKLFLPPLTLQLLVENAIKHNTTKKNDPLRIKIYTDGSNRIIVENKLAPLLNKAPHSTGTGLANINQRYALLAKPVPEILISKDTFKVIIHLIGYDQ
jgi:two-component system LytT family sensor kinase